MEMRLLTITSGAGCTGATISLLNLINGLSKKGVKIMVVIPEEGFLCRELTKSGIPFKVIPYKFSIWPSFQSLKEGVFSSLSFFYSRKVNSSATKKIAEIIELFKPDIIHTNTSVINIGYLLSRKYGIPHVWHIREYGDKDFDFNSYPSKRLLRHRLSTHSHAIAITHDLARYYDLDDKSKVIYNGILSQDDYHFTPTKRKVFLFVGRVTKNKGANDVIDAFIQFSDSDREYCLELVGHYGKRYKSRLLKRIQGTPAEGRVKFLGHQDNPISYMRTSKALIVPSFYEGFGRITAEAMFNGCLVIGRNTAGTKEQMDNGVRLTGNEIALRFSTIDDIVHCMQSVATMSEEDYGKLVKNASFTVKTLYSNESNIETTLAYLQEIVDKNRSNMR
ncbi:glycosyltransferase family 4 protein [Barnesiella sp. WM24]|uniref:glycosyltransferase family 4 protein n=1 Tax=Barnesiella sp. WM24 TaxID=2558278 RepID=UPI001430A5A9|nr:glycosyltransferase family 4 protein [Barnesiella sp. WM24]